MAKPLPFRLVVILLIVVSGLALALGGSFLFISGQRAMVGMMSILAGRTAHAVADQVAAYLDAPTRALTHLEQLAAQGHLDMANRQGALDLLLGVSRTHPEVIGAVIANDQGEFLGCNVRPGGEEVLLRALPETDGHLLSHRIGPNGEPGAVEDDAGPYDPRLRPWYQSARNQDGAVWSPIFQTLDTGYPIIALLRPIFRGETFIGVANATITLPRLSGFLNDLDLGPRGIAFIVDEGGALVASSSNEEPFSAEGRRRLASEADDPRIPPLFAAIEALTTGAGETLVDIESAPYVVRVVRRRDEFGLDWRIITALANDDYLEPIFQERRRTVAAGLLFSGLSLLFGLLIIWFIWRETDRRHLAEEELVASRRRYQGLFDNMPNGVTVFHAVDDGADFILADLNKAAQCMEPGLGPAVFGRSIMGLFPPFRETALFQTFRQVLRSGQAAFLPVKCPEDGGPERWFDFYIFPLPTGEIVAIHHDVSETKRAQKTIQDLARFPDENPNPVMRVAANGKVLYANQGARPVLAAFHCAIGDRISDPWRSWLLGVLDSGRPHYREMAMADRTISLALAPIPDGGYVNLYGLDVTELRRTLSLLEKNRRQLETLNADLEQRVQKEVDNSRAKDLLLIQQSRLAAMGEMVGNIAHQWRQPINALALILANIQDAAAFGELTPEEAARMTAKGQGIIQRMSTTIDDFRSFFRPGKEKASFLLNDAVTNALSLVEAAFGNHNIQLHLEAPDGPVTGFGFENEFSQVVLVLLGNAKDAILEQRPDVGTVALHLARRGEVAELTIQDNGGGIPEELMQRIFEPYFTTKGVQQGTGIGLYMARMIIQEHMEGQIEIANAGPGARFTITLPTRPTEEAQAPSSTEIPAAPPAPETTPNPHGGG